MGGTDGRGDFRAVFLRERPNVLVRPDRGATAEARLIDRGNTGTGTGESVRGDIGGLTARERGGIIAEETARGELLVLPTGVRTADVRDWVEAFEFVRWSDTASVRIGVRTRGGLFGP